MSIRSIMLLILHIPTFLTQFSTTYNTCLNEKKVFKLDIRARVEQLQSGSTIENIDAYALCQEVFDYDYIWLHQLWTPSRYNYINVNGIPQQTNDYRELENIKEYQIDPVLGTLTNLYKFQQNVKTFCLHIKFLGEFSFYVPKDSYLMQNISRFLRKPLYANPNIYSGRYDDENFLWAYNDQMKTVPFAVPWNYFSTKGIQDMLDLIYRVIITGHKLDGIVFLQPSLGLCKFITQYYYFNEIFDQAEPLLTKDFYQNIKLESKATDLFFMGGKDNSKFKSLLLNFLQIIYEQPTPSNNWANVDYRFQGGPNIDQISQRFVRGSSATTLSYPSRVRTSMPPTKNTCIKFNYTNYEWGAAGIMLEGQGLYVLIPNHTREIIPNLAYYPYTFLSDPDRNASFNYGKKDIIEVQFEPQSYLIRYKKLFLENSQQASTYMQQESNYSKIAFMGSVAGNQQVLQIAFPFMFSQTLKHSYFVVLGHQHIKLNVDNPVAYYLAQIEPSINQLENNFTLNFFTLFITPGRQVGLGVCDKERIQKNNHESGPSVGLGTYLLFTNGSKIFKQQKVQWHNATGQENVQKEFSQGYIITVTYSNNNKSLIYYKNQTFLHSFQLLDNVRNLNYCIAMIGYQTTVSLEY